MLTRIFKGRTIKAPFLSASIAVAIGLLTLAVFLPSLKNGFVNWDDDANLVLNAGYRGLSWDHLKWMWTSHLTSHYLPLSWMSFGLDYVIWKDNPLGYHLTNILLNAANAAIFFLLVLAILKRTFPTDSAGAGSLMWGAAFAALFFGLHPLRVESVAWATERRDVLSGLFYLLAVLVYVRGVSKDASQGLPVKSYLACLTLFLMAILSKEITVTLPVILLILDVYPLGRLGGLAGWTGPGARRVYLEKIPFFALGLADAAQTLYFGVRNHLVEPVAALGWTARIAITVYGMAFYLFKTILPIGLSPLYPLTRYKTLPSATPFQLSAVVVVVVTLTCILLWRKYPGFLAAWVASAITLLPVGGIFHNGLQIAADRYTYLACLGWAVMAGAGVTLAWRAASNSRIQRTLIASAALGVILTLSLLTWRQQAVWRNSETLWTRAVAVEPFFASHLNLASALFNEGDTLGAIDQYRRASALWPENAAIRCMLGGALLDARQGAEAAREFRLAIGFSPSTDAYKGLVRALVMQGKLDEAIRTLQQALRGDPGNAQYQKIMDQAIALKQKPESNPASSVVP